MTDQHSLEFLLDCLEEPLSGLLAEAVDRMAHLQAGHCHWAAGEFVPVLSVFEALDELGFVAAPSPVVEDLTADVTVLSMVAVVVVVVLNLVDGQDPPTQAIELGSIEPFARC